MRNILALLILAFLSFTVYAGDPVPPKEVSIGRLSLYLLKNVEENQKAFRVDYPGRISGICTLIIRTGSPSFNMRKFVSRFTITDYNFAPVTPDYSVPGTVIYKLTPETFIDGIVIAAKNKKSIGENVQSLLDLPNDNVGILAGSCPNSAAV